MKKRQIITDFLFPTDEKTPGAVGPGMAPFHNPPTRSATALALHRNLAFARHVQNVFQPSRQFFRRSRDVAFVQAEMLFATPSRFRTSYRHRSQCGTQQRNVGRVGCGDGHADRHAAGIGHDGTLDAEFTAIGGIFAGFFPRPAALWSSRRLMLATAMRSPVARRRSGDISSRSDRRCDVGSIPGSNDARCLRRQIEVAMPSIDSPCVRDRRFRWRLAGD